jgi:hypothetical protein
MSAGAVGAPFGQLRAREREDYGMRAKRLWLAMGVVVLACAAIAATASATVTSVSGELEKIAAPPSVQLDQLVSNDVMRTFDEQQCVRLAQDLVVDIDQPGKYNQFSDLPNPKPVIPAGTLVSSHLVHADNSINDPDHPITFLGSLVVDADIIGISVREEQLNASDVLGAFVTSYPKSQRSLNLGPGQDDFVIELDPRNVTVQAENHAHIDQVRVITKCAERLGARGCSPGYWKQAHHFDSYPAAYPPSTLFNAAFGLPANTAPYAGKTLPQVAAMGGGGLNALGRQAVAALLSAASPGVDYPLGSGEVIVAVRNAVLSGDKNKIESLKDQLDAFNNRGCPLN